MANIVVSMYRFSKDPMLSNSMPPYYQALLEGLKENGNNILCFYHDIYGSKWDSRKMPDFVAERIEAFSPDVFILFNYEFFDCSKEYNVPFIIYDVDSPNRYQNKTAIFEQPDRYKFAVIQESGRELIKTFYNIEDTQIHYIKPFTGIRNKPQSTVSNIGFCGSHWIWSGCDSIYQFMKMQPTADERKMAQEILKKYRESPYGDIEKLYEQNGYYPDRRLQDPNLMLAGRLSGLKRMEYLTNISDLGLEIRGEFWNHPCLNYYPEVALCYNPQPTVTLFENQCFYNSVRIGFNVNHIQATTGFSWRVCDILASGACLVSEYTPDLAKHFSKLGIPMYTNKHEAREECIKLLSDEDRRSEIVAASNELIDQEYRFKNVLYDLEELCGISLSSEQEGSINYVNLTGYLTDKGSGKKPIKLKDRIERKLWHILGEDLKKKKLI